MGRQHNRCRWCTGNFHWGLAGHEKAPETYQNAEPDSPDSISSSSSSSPELHVVPQPKRQKNNQLQLPNHRNQRCQSYRLGRWHNITSTTCEFRSITPSPLYLYTDPGMSHHQHQLDHHTHSFRSSQQHYLVPQQLRQQMTALHQKLNLISTEHLFPVPDYNQHPLFSLTLTTSSNTFQPSTTFQVRLLLQSSTPPRVLATLQNTWQKSYPQSFLLKSVSVGFILTMVTRRTTTINWFHHVFSLWKSLCHTLLTRSNPTTGMETCGYSQNKWRPAETKASKEDTDVINEQWLTIVIVMMLIISSLNIFNIYWS